MSLDNAFDGLELVPGRTGWPPAPRRRLGTLDFSAEPKVDGVAMSLTYVDGRFTRPPPRDGVTGEDVTANVATISVCRRARPRSRPYPHHSRCAASLPAHVCL